MELTKAIKAILSDTRTEISAELLNQLHSCCDDHPWCQDKPPAVRKRDAVFAAIQASHIDATLLHNLQRCKIQNRSEITLNVSDLELNVLQVAIDHMIDHCSDVIGLESDEENELWVVRMHAAENLRLALNTQIKISNGQ